MPKFRVQVEWTSTIEMEIATGSLSLAMDKIEHIKHGGIPSGLPKIVPGSVRANADKTRELNPRRTKNGKNQKIH